MEVLYHLVPYFWPYFVGIFPYIGLKNRPLIHGYGHGYGLQMGPGGSKWIMSIPSNLGYPAGC